MSPWLQFYKTPPRRVIINPYVFPVGTLPTLVAHTSKSAGMSGVTTDPINTTGAVLIVISVALLVSGGVGALSDSNGNTWTQLTAAADTGVESRIYYCYSPIVGSGHTFTFGNYYPSVCVQAWSTVTLAGFDNQSAAFTSSSATVSPGSITPAQATELFVTNVAINGTTGETASIDNGFTITDQEGFLTANHFGSAFAYKIVSNGAAQNPQWTYSISASQLLSVMGAFKY